jgi:SAM-dependent methyltransferase
MSSLVSTSELGNSQIAEKFYEERYQEGYMDEWPVWKKNRVIELIHELDLPETGNALDFGCGRGIFSQVLKQALPKWQITGCDISQTALKDAKLRFPQLEFSAISELLQNHRKFDLIFSHHVLEHVSEIHLAIDELSKLQNPGTCMFHIMPCGNQNSFEYNLASKVVGGIDKSNGNRFYFEDVGHVRRLSSSDLDSLFADFNYQPHKCWFANQTYGSLEWMSDSPDSLINEIVANPAIAKNNQASKDVLLKLKNQILRLKLARRFAKEGKKHRIKMRLLEFKSKPWSIFHVISNIFSDLSLVNEGLTFQSNLDNEWSSNKLNKAGSEMYASYIKT